MKLPMAVIIEDDPHLNQIFSVTLKAHFSIENLSDGDTASRRLVEVIPDLIVLDLNLPGITGKKILDQIKADPRLEKTRVILATADDRQAEILRDQADVVLLKPFSPALLRDLAIRLHSPRRMTDEQE